MIKDEVYDQDHNKVIEILIESLWIPVIATDLRIFNRNKDLVRVEAVRVRDLSEEL